MDQDHVFGHEPQSAVSWAAVFAGAVVALALSFVLLTLAAGFGLKLASPWPGGHLGFGFTPILGAWMIVVQVVSITLGGYLAGRLRTKWLNVHGHEVHFRDTAHGLLVWALATVVGVALAAHMGPAFDPVPPLDAIDVQRQANIAAQLSLFLAVGLLTSAFTASVAAAIGGMRRDEMHGVFWEGRRSPGPPDRL